VLGGVVSAAPGEAGSALTLGDAVPPIVLGVVAGPLGFCDAISALELGAAVSLPMPGEALATGALLSVAPPFAAAEAEEEVEAGSLSDAVDGASAALLFGATFGALELFGAFFGALSGSVLVTGAEETGAAGAGATSEREPASATTAGGVWLVAAALVSFAGEDATCDSLALATAFGAAMTLPSI
jgi:hypothetical protein